MVSWFVFKDTFSTNMLYHAMVILIGICRARREEKKQIITQIRNITYSATWSLWR